LKDIFCKLPFFELHFQFNIFLCSGRERQTPLLAKGTSYSFALTTTLHIALALRKVSLPTDFADSIKQNEIKRTIGAKAIFNIF